MMDLAVIEKLPGQLVTVRHFTLVLYFLNREYKFDNFQTDLAYLLVLKDISMIIPGEHPLHVSHKMPSQVCFTS